MAEEGDLELIVGSGSSMAPLLCDGDRIQVRRSDRYRAGDLLVFRNSVDTLVVHRLLGRRWHRGGWHYVLRGDAAPAFDGLVDPGKVLGRVVGGEVNSSAFEIGPEDRLKARWRYLTYWFRRLRR
ncbi:MAG: S24/S26 family peptidase [Thermoanaerobaculia bacterium]